MKSRGRGVCRVPVRLMFFGSSQSGNLTLTVNTSVKKVIQGLIIKVKYMILSFRNRRSIFEIVFVSCQWFSCSRWGSKDSVGSQEGRHGRSSYILFSPCESKWFKIRKGISSWIFTWDRSKNYCFWRHSCLLCCTRWREQGTIRTIYLYYNTEHKVHLGKVH